MRRARIAIFGVSILLVLASVVPALAGGGTPGSVRQLLSAAKTPDGGEQIMQRADERAEARTSPGGSVAAGALAAARAQAGALPVVKGTWTKAFDPPCAAGASFGHYKFISDVAVRPGTG